MKLLKLALLGTAAVAAVASSARADELGDLKAQINALNARVANMEATPSVPAGYSMVNFSNGNDIYVPGYYAGNKNNGPAHVISIIPSADAPQAASAMITWSGWVRGAVVTARNINLTNPTVSIASAAAVAPGTVSTASMASSTTSQYFTDIRVRGEIVVSGRTDTAVGEVGARLALETGAAFNDTGGIFNGGNSGAVTTDGFWGWWRMTPNLTLGAGIDGSLAKNSRTFDASCTCYYEATGGAIINNPNLVNGAPYNDPAQIRLTYNDGPLSFAVAVEDSNNWVDNSSFGVAAKALWAGDMFSADLSGGYWGNTMPNGSAAWNVNAGAGVGIGDMGTVSAAVGYGSDFSGNTQLSASAFAKLTMADMAHAEIGVTRRWNTSNWDMNLGTTVGGGVYYDPVKQLTIGAEGSYTFSGVNDGAYVADLVTVFRF